MTSNKRIIVWTDRPPFFIKTPFLFLSNKGYDVTFLYRRDDNQADRIHTHSLNDYGRCELVNCQKILFSRSNLIEYISANKNAIHVVNGFYISKCIQYKKLKTMFPSLKIFILSEKPMTFRKPHFLFGLYVGLNSFFKAIKNKKYIDGILGLGEKACDYFVKHGWPKAKVHNFIYSFDFDVLTKKEHTPFTPRRFIYIGRFDFEIKGVNYLIKSIKSLIKAKKSFSFDFIGGYGKNKEKVMDFIKSEKQCNYLGNLQFYDMISIVSQYDCIVVPSIKDGWNINVLIGLICGIPVICTDGSGSEELIRQFKYGLIGKKRNQKSLATMMKIMIDDDNTYLKCLDNLKKYSKRFTNRIVANYLESVIIGEKKECVE